MAETPEVTAARAALARAEEATIPLRVAWAAASAAYEDAIAAYAAAKDALNAALDPARNALAVAVERQHRTFGPWEVNEGPPLIVLRVRVNCDPSWPASQARLWLVTGPGGIRRWKMDFPAADHSGIGRILVPGETDAERMAAADQILRDAGWILADLAGGAE